ncbi:MAG: AsmA-like C-terminal region-containing protein [Bacteroidota bacterium]|nr:AsmA-like C-terminal region-containing protein [Bacteroidota bacterium]
MKKILKISAIVIAALLVILIVTPFLFKGKITDSVKKELNSSLNAKVDFGKLTISMFRGFPDLYVSLDDLSVEGIGDFKGDTLVSFKSFSAKVDIMSVIRGESINVKSVILDHPNIFAKVLKNGKVNWDIVKPDSVKKKEAKPSPPMKFHVKLQKVKIIDGNLTYSDDTLNVLANLKDLNFQLKGDMTQDFTSLDLKTDVKAVNVSYGGIHYIKDLVFRFMASIDADMKKSEYTLKDNEIDINDLVMSLIGSVKMPGDDMNIDLKFNTKQADFKSVLSLVPAVYMNDFKSVKTEGKFKIGAWVKGTYNSKKKSMPSAGLALVVNNAMFKYPSLPKSANNINVDLKVLYDGVIPDKTTVDLNKFHVEMAGNPVDMVMHVATPISDPQIKGNVKGHLDLQSIADVIPLEKTKIKGIIDANLDMAGRMSSITKKRYEEFKALGNLSLRNFTYTSESLPQGALISKAVMVFSSQFVNLTAFDAKVGKSDFHLNGKIENFIQYIFKNEVLKGKFAFSSNLIDVNEFMSGNKKASTSESATSSSTAEQTPMTVLEVPKNVDFRLSTNIKKVVYDKLDVSNIKGTILVNDSKATMENVKMNLLQGAMSMSGSYSTKEVKKPLVDFVLGISDFDIPSTFEAFNTVKKLAPIAKNCKGKVSMNLTFASALDQHMNPVYSTTEGKGVLKSKSVEVGNTATFNKIADALKNDKLRRFALNNLNLSFEIKNGRVYIKPFDTKIGANNINISGDQGIDQTMNYVMKMTLPMSELGGAANHLLGNLTAAAASKGLNIKSVNKININLHVGGTTSKPEVKLMMGGGTSESGKEMVKDQAKQLINAKKQELMGKASAEAEKLIKNAEAQAEQIRNAAQKVADQIKKQAEDKASLLEKQASGQPKFLQTTTKKAADKIRAEGDKKANQTVTEANTKADAIIQKAKDEAAKLK